MNEQADPLKDFDENIRNMIDLRDRHKDDILAASIFAGISAVVADMMFFGAFCVLGEPDIQKMTKNIIKLYDIHLQIVEELCSAAVRDYQQYGALAAESSIDELMKQSQDIQKAKQQCLELMT